MQIAAGALTSTAVVEDGEWIALRLRDVEGRPVELRLSVADAGSVAMTLPRLVRDALRRKYRDEALRHVFPLEQWSLEAASDGVQLILTLRTGGSFEVSFAAPASACRMLGTALHRGVARQPVVSMPMAN